LLLGRYEASTQLGTRAIALNPVFSSSYKTQLSALGHLGRREQAAEIRARLLALEPGFSVSQALERSPIQNKLDRERYAEGLRLGGLG
jgi:adenylate cyclase